MKQIIFLCLLSLTLCLSSPTTPQVTTVHPDVTTTVKPSDPPTVSAGPTQSAPKPNGPEEKPASMANPPSITPPTTQPTHVDDTKPNTSTTTSINNKTTEKKEEAAPPKGSETKNAESTTVAAKENVNETKPAATNGMKPDPKNVTATVTTMKPTETTKLAPAAKTDEDTHIVKARGFDGPSFIGGIILTLGLLAIGFMGFKYYKNQTERNYHTL